MLHREFPEKTLPCFSGISKFTSINYYINKASRKFKEYKRFRYFVRYFCTQKNVGKSSKSWKMNKKSAGTINAFDNVACKYPATKIYIEENLKQNT